jgi:hypothetical protein
MASAGPRETRGSFSPQSRAEGTGQDDLELEAPRWGDFSCWPASAAIEAICEPIGTLRPRGGILIFMQRITAGLKRIRSFCDCAARAINLKANMKVIFLDIDGVPKAA